jgi:hypothetical protein
MHTGWGNNQVVWFTAGSNLAFANGSAVLTAKFNPSGGSQAYTSTQINTRWKRSFGSSSGGSGIRFEARVQLPPGVASEKESKTYLADSCLFRCRIQKRFKNLSCLFLLILPLTGLLILLILPLKGSE